jgi:hypothetical protein
MTVTIAAYIFAVLNGIIILFQAGLAAGAPWGAASMGGKYPGKYPPKMRIVAIINALILLFITAIVLSKAGLFFLQLLQFSQIAIWVVAVFFLAGTIMNIITPSKIERIWAPVAFVQLITSVIVAVN